LKALRFMTQFRCLAEKCEDTCCAGLNVPLTPRDVRRLERSGCSSSELEAALHRHEDGGATFRPRGDGCCHFLGEDRLCSLQQRHGVDALSEICASFPRVVSSVGEVTGSLACPEVARLALLGGDEAMELVEADAAVLFVRAPEEAAVHPEQSRGRAVREAARRIFGATEVPLSGRVAAWGQISAQLDEAESEEQAVALAEGVDASLAKDTAELLEQLQLKPAAAAGVAVRLLLATPGATSERLERLQAKVRAAFAPEGEVDSERVWASYVSRRSELKGPGLDRLIQRYVALYLFRNAPTEGRPLVPDAVELAVRLLLLRVALVATVSSEDVDATMVETVQVLAKHVEQAGPMKALLAQLCGDDALMRMLLCAAAC
jgi:lysine-N-methylase